MTLNTNPAISQLPRYNAGMNIDIARERSGRQDIAALASNENPDGCSPAVRVALATLDFDPSRYPDPACKALRQAISAHVRVPADNIVVGNGSEELVAAISRSFVVAGAKALTVVPSFGLHEIDPLAAGASVDKVPMTETMQMDIEALLEKLAQAPSVFFLPVPSNPVGCSLSRTDLERLAAATPQRTVLVIDEAYFEFRGADAPDGVDFLDRPGLNCVVLRTFSKAYGLAGLRVGYALCSSPDVAELLMRAKPPFDVNSAAQWAAIAALKDQAWMKASVERICAERDRVAAELAVRHIYAAESHANFLFIRTAMPADGVADRLLMQGIIVKPWKEQGFTDFLRVTIGTRAENDRFMEALCEILSTGAGA